MDREGGTSMRVLLATDGSASADRARDLVATLTWPRGTVVRVVIAVEPHLEMLAAPFAMTPSNVIDDLDAELLRHAEGTLDAAELVLRAAGLTVERLVLPERAADAIVEQAREWGASLVVLGNRGHSSMASMILGSTSAEVVDHAPCPVLVARERAVDEVVLGVDGSPGAQLAEHLLTDWPMFHRLPASVVAIATTGVPWNPGMASGLYDAVVESYAHDVDAARREVAELADGVAARLRGAGVATTAHVREGDPAAELVSFARGRSRPLLVLGSRGHTGLARLLLGGVARNVLYHAPGSVLIVRQGVPVKPEPADEAGEVVSVR
jgi:nucleotide-binding universal stress UspA family protein